jgi:hypothetical protein
MPRRVGKRAAALLFCALPAMAQPAQTAPQTPPAQQSAPAKDRLELICRSVKSAGSRNASPERHTQEEWDGQTARLRARAQRQPPASDEQKKGPDFSGPFSSRMRENQQLKRLPLPAFFAWPGGQKPALLAP